MPADMIAMLERNDPLSNAAISTRSASGVDLRDRIEDRLRKRRLVLPLPIPGPALALIAAAVTILVGLSVIAVRSQDVEVVDRPATTTVPVATTAAEETVPTTVPSSTTTTTEGAIPQTLNIRRALDVGALGDAWWVERVELVDERLLAVGARIDEGELDGGMWASEDGDAWSPVDLASIAGMPGYQSLLGVATDGTVTVAVGLAAVSSEGEPASDVEAAAFVPLAIRSDDGGATWSLAGTETAGEGRMLVVTAVPGGGFLAGGDGVWRSGDGTAWERVADTGTIWELVGWNGGFAAAGESSAAVQTATMWWSEDGAEWQEFETPKDRPIEERSRAWGLTTTDDDVLVAVGTFGDVRVGGDAAVWTSRDGVEWTRSPHDAANLGGGRYESMFTAVSLDRAVVAFGEAVTAPPETIGQAAAWLSEDGGSTWNRLTPDDEVFGSRFSGMTYIRSAAVIDGRIVAVGLDDDVGMAWVAEISG